MIMLQYTWSGRFERFLLLACVGKFTCWICAKLLLKEAGGPFERSRNTFAFSKEAGAPFVFCKFTGGQNANVFFEIIWKISSIIKLQNHVWRCFIYTIRLKSKEIVFISWRLIIKSAWVYFNHCHHKQYVEITEYPQDNTIVSNRWYYDILSAKHAECVLWRKKILRSIVNHRWKCHWEQ